MRLRYSSALFLSLAMILGCETSPLESQRVLKRNLVKIQQQTTKDERVTTERIRDLITRANETYPDCRYQGMRGPDKIFRDGEIDTYWIEQLEYGAICPRLNFDTAEVPKRSQRTIILEHPLDDSHRARQFIQAQSSEECSYKGVGSLVFTGHLEAVRNYVIDRYTITGNEADCPEITIPITVR